MHVSISSYAKLKPTVDNFYYHCKWCHLQNGTVRKSDVSPKQNENNANTIMQLISKSFFLPLILIWVPGGLELILDSTELGIILNKMQSYTVGNLKTISPTKSPLT